MLQDEDAFAPLDFASIGAIHLVREASALSCF